LGENRPKLVNPESSRIVESPLEVIQQRFWVILDDSRFFNPIIVSESLIRIASESCLNLLLWLPLLHSRYCIYTLERISNQVTRSWIHCMKSREQDVGIEINNAEHDLVSLDRHSISVLPRTSVDINATAIWHVAKCCAES
jgi:hypothetical protein